jgi:protein involved in polysaccharide export with SLBB domain
MDKVRTRPLSAAVFLAASLLAGPGGCAAVSNPVANGVPVRRLPPEMLARPKKGDRTIPLSVLRQKPPDVYRLAARDILGVWVEGVLGEEKQTPPVHFSENSMVPPAIGFPMPVREDGTLALPLIEPVKVAGLTVEEAEAAIRQAYTVKKQILQPGGSRRILVTLLQRRRYPVLVIRQDSPPTTGTTPPGTTTASGQRQIGFVLSYGGTGPTQLRGTGYAVELPAYENDVLNALAVTGGLPGLDAINEVVIQRGYFKAGQNPADVLRGLENCPPEWLKAPPAGTADVVRIPLRTPGGQAPPIRPEDIILQTGDIVFIEAREAELFYTGGLLPPGEYLLPRDHDLDVVEAVARVGFPIVTNGINPYNINGNINAISGIGSPSPSLLAVVRKLPNGGQLPIRVDLNRALCDPRERLLVQAGDVLILQETPAEGFARYFNQSFFRFTFIWRAILSDRTNGTVTVTTP